MSDKNAKRDYTRGSIANHDDAANNVNTAPILPRQPGRTVEPVIELSEGVDVVFTAILLTWLRRN